MASLCDLLAMAPAEYAAHVRSLDVCDGPLLEQIEKSGVVYAHVYLGILPSSMSPKGFRALTSRLLPAEDGGRSQHMPLPFVQPGAVLPKLSEDELASVNLKIDQKLQYIVAKINETDDADAKLYFKAFFNLEDEDMSSGAELFKSLHSKYAIDVVGEHSAPCSIADLFTMEPTTFYEQFVEPTAKEELKGVLQRLTFAQLVLGIVPLGVYGKIFVDCQQAIQELGVARVALAVGNLEVNDHLICPYLTHEKLHNGSISTGLELLHFLEIFGFMGKGDNHVQQFRAIIRLLDGECFSQGAVAPYLTSKDIVEVRERVRSQVSAVVSSISAEMRALFCRYFKVDGGPEALNAFMEHHYLNVFPTKVYDPFPRTRFVCNSYPGPYVELDNLRKDFMRALHEILDGEPSIPPGVYDYMGDEENVKWLIYGDMRVFPGEKKLLKFDYFAPYSVIVNSKGTGKTNFLLQPKFDESTYTFMILFPCSYVLVPGPVPIRYHTKSYESWAYGVLMDKIECHCAGRISTIARILANVLKAARDHVFDENGELKPRFDEFATIFADDILGVDDLTPIGTEEEYERTLQSCQKLTNRQGKRVVLCFGFDDAEDLVRTPIRAQEACRDMDGRWEEGRNDGQMVKTSAFRVVRRALRYLSRKYVVPCFFASSDPYILDPYPEELERHIPPYGYGIERPLLDELKKINLHRPVVVRGTTDLFLHLRLNPDSIEGKNPEGRWFGYLQSKRHLQDMVFYGRPYWLEVFRRHECVSRVLDEVQRMSPPLAPYADMERWDMEIMKEAWWDGQVNALWVFGRCLHLPPITHDVYAQDLVRSRGAYLYDFRDTLGISMAGFPAEPVMACFASHQLNKQPLLAIKLFERAVLNTGLKLGRMGELMARFVLSIAQFRSEPIVDFGSFENFCCFTRGCAAMFSPRTTTLFLENLCLGSDKLQEVPEEHDSSEFRKCYQNYVEHFKDSVVSFCFWQLVGTRDDKKPGPQANSKRGDKSCQDEERGFEKIQARKDTTYLEDVIRSGLLRGSALMLERWTCPRVNFVIPVCYKSTEKQYGAILVQVNSQMYLGSKELRMQFDEMQRYWKRSSLPVAHLIMVVDPETTADPLEAAETGAEFEIAIHPSYPNVCFDMKEGNRPGLAIIGYHSCLPRLYALASERHDRKKLFELIEGLGSVESGETYTGNRLPPEAFPAECLANDAHPNPRREEIRDETAGGGRIVYKHPHQYLTDEELNSTDIKIIYRV